jgi:leucyl-tRNA synthetase
MSKSKNNVVEPRDIISRYGADTARLFTMFAGPPDQSAAWSDSGAEGGFRFLRRLWNHAQAVGASIKAASVTTDWASADDAVRAVRREVHQILQEVQRDYDRLHYNTVVSAGMRMLNALESAKDPLAPAASALQREGLGILLRVLAPVVPHICHVLWEELQFAKQDGPLLDAAWPAVDPAALVTATIDLVLQVNGKLRGQIQVAANAPHAEIEAAALASPEVVRHTEGRPVKKVVVVPGRLVNVVA